MNRILLQSISGVLGVAIASTVWVEGVQAQSRTRFQPFAEEFNQAATRSSGDAFKNQSLMGQLSVFFGLSYPWPGAINGFPESLIADDARRVNQLYRERMLEQTLSSPTVRTPDLANPYNTSILTQPSVINQLSNDTPGGFLFNP
ncbi:hypothetical protein B9T07_05980 [Limnospira fusiformis CCALA 023]|nr:hypothetical protein [Arthrospira sp. PLM2.Bin9]TVU53714.1 MAG: hypothetical protein EA414_10960 [Arthrospira sp. PLM2.Bin9]